MITDLAYLEISRGFGFLRFPSLARSREFVESNYPSIFFSKKFSDNDSAAVKIRIAFSREKEDGKWTCKLVSVLAIAIL